jgi:hypothetical protein
MVSPSWSEVARGRLYSRQSDHPADAERDPD